MVVGHRKDDVIAAFAGDDADITWVEQAEQLGTGHAALVCEEALEGFTGPVLTIAGDMPLIRQQTVEEVLAENARTGDAVTLATAVLDDPASYGRIVRDETGALVGIVEHNDCTPEQREIDEVNISYYCFDGGRMFDLLHRIEVHQPKGEYYITDTLEIARRQGWGIGAVPAVPAEDAMGVNSRVDLTVVGGMMQDRILGYWLDNAVTIVDPASTWIETGAMLGRDCVIYPYSFIGADARVGEGCRIGPHGMVPRGATIEAGAACGNLAVQGA